MQNPTKAVAHVKPSPGAAGKDKAKQSSSSGKAPQLSHGVNKETDKTDSRPAQAPIKITSSVRDRALDTNEQKLKTGGTTKPSTSTGNSEAAGSGASAQDGQQKNIQGSKEAQKTAAGPASTWKDIYDSLSDSSDDDDDDDANDFDDGDGYGTATKYGRL